KKVQKKKRSISRKGARSKGHNFERDCANALVSVFPEARRQLEYHADDALGCDIQNTYPYLIQCKKFKKYVNPSVIKEVQCERILGEVPILVTAGDFLEPLAILPWTELIRLLKIEKDSLA